MPDVLGGDEEALVLGRLEEDLDPPRLFAGLMAAAGRFVVEFSGGNEPEAGAQRPGGRESAAPPVPQDGLQFVEMTPVVRIDRDRGVGGGEGGQERLSGGELPGP